MGQINCDEWYRETFEKMYDAVLVYLYSRCRKVHLLDSVEDFAQEVFWELWKHRKKLITHPNIQGWLYAVSVNKMVDQFRKVRREQSVEDIDTVAKWAENKLEEAELIQEHLDEVTSLLDDDTLRLLIDYYNKEIPNEELAKYYGISPEALKKRVSRTIKVIRSKYMVVILFASLVLRISRYIPQK